MSSRAARPFLSTLRRLDVELPVPVGDRVRILRELEFDLEELGGRFEAEGHSREEARKKALDALVPDAATLQELERLHEPWYRRATRGFSQTRVRAAERLGLATLTVLVLLGQTAVLLRTDLFADPSPFLWPVLVLGAITFAVATAQGFALWVKRADPAGEPKAGVLLLLAGVTMGIGLLGALADTGQVLAASGGLPGPFDRAGVVWWRREAALVAVAMVLALTGALAWFVITHRVRLVAGARFDVLGFNYSTEEAPGGRHVRHLQ